MWVCTRTRKLAPPSRLRTVEEILGNSDFVINVPEVMRPFERGCNSKQSAKYREVGLHVPLAALGLPTGHAICTYRVARKDDENEQPDEPVR